MSEKPENIFIEDDNELIEHNRSKSYPTISDSDISDCDLNDSDIFDDINPTIMTTTSNYKSNKSYFIKVSNNSIRRSSSAPKLEILRSLSRSSIERENRLKKIEADKVRTNQEISPR